MNLANFEINGASLKLFSDAADSETLAHKEPTVTLTEDTQYTQKPPHFPVNLNDLELVAQNILKPSTEAHLSSVTDDELTKQQNVKEIKAVTTLCTKAC
ncbi:hypothetical protein SBOR_5539 [Sclerotinia borealis F-4128]|uniref:Uncharacterized protein n=1 Tax=Sclerotinia borealis (strain F-4128) TaxID=1432307 RepID=W9CDZ0_SCLBF|nr:hypothetical protein SBOR_5539 [Sclerotinia borealis F-4128]